MTKTVKVIAENSARLFFSSEEGEIPRIKRLVNMPPRNIMDIREPRQIEIDKTRLSRMTRGFAELCVEAAIKLLDPGNDAPGGPVERYSKPGLVVVSGKTRRQDIASMGSSAESGKQKEQTR